jgi:hypothetical protein
VVFRRTFSSAVPLGDAIHLAHGVDISNGRKQSRWRSNLIILDTNLYRLDCVGEKVHEFLPRQTSLKPGEDVGVFYQCKNMVPQSPLALRKQVEPSPCPSWNVQTGV